MNILRQENSVSMLLLSYSQCRLFSNVNEIVTISLKNIRSLLYEPLSIKRISNRKDLLTAEARGGSNLLKRKIAIRMTSNRYPKEFVSMNFNRSFA